LPIDIAVNENVLEPYPALCRDATGELGRFLRPRKSALNGPADGAGHIGGNPMRISSISSIAVAAIFLLGGLPASAEEEMNPAAMAKALQQASLPLEKAMKLTEREGKPISAKYEIEHGGLQLSIYTQKGNRFSEVIVDHKSGAVAKDEWIADADDMKAAQMQAAAMAKAKVSLDVAAEHAVGANAGYRAVSVIPKLDGDRPVAVVTLLKGDEVKKVNENLE
jgi:hypothetical protein